VLVQERGQRVAVGVLEDHQLLVLRCRRVLDGGDGRSPSE
jgi:hypothetical protein